MWNKPGWIVLLVVTAFTLVFLYVNNSPPIQTGGTPEYSLTNQLLSKINQLQEAVKLRTTAQSNSWSPEKEPSKSNGLSLRSRADKIPKDIVGESLKTCAIEKGMWDSLPLEITECAKSTSNLSLPQLLYFNMGRLKEKKYFMHFRKEIAKRFETAESPENSELGVCTFLTLGIGGDWEVEKEVKKMYPACQIFGIEASGAQVGKFTNYGTPIIHPVGLTNGTARLKIRAKGSYYSKTMPVVPFLTLLDKYMNGTRFIYFMTIDLEGYEFTILEGFLKSGVLSKGSLVICQIDVELHSFRKKEFADFWMKFLQETDYVPIAAAKFLSHRKVTFVHSTDPRCNKLFPIDSLK